MKKSMSLIIVALLLALACVLSGCNDDGDKGKKKDDGRFEETSGPADESESQGLEFAPDESGDGWIVVGIGTCTDLHVVIPTFHEGKLVTGIGESAFKNCDTLTGITIPNSITQVFASSFEGCENLQINMTDATSMHTLLSDWVVDTPATCKSEGRRHRECLDEGCTSFFTEVIPTGDHTPSDWIVDTPASCETDGAQHKVCTVAGCG